ncbi:penicillin-insensitive murein endopeptidase [Salipiger pallidus]|uniref:Penicillin-insensitive murein endopeptidase n=1 Tax=Salipiger pallidus TaxID=1775170 RepID=A0A8J2ZK49_9RHOB|nr:penicillin-insensitive murein endopeptidase [Salipiger pallidus]GGG72088.1 penicillin-insensitive murein endopeptidase [Salipiger pallidus]
MIRTITALALATAVLTGCGGDRPVASVSEEDLPRVTGAISTKSAKAMFGSQSVGSGQSPAAYGSYSKGCAAGAVQLPETGSTWQAMRLSRNRNWALPITVDYVQDLSRKAAQLPGWNGIYVGDMSQPRGGPMTSGHASHQVGLDADIWLRPATDMNLSRSARENISSISMRRQSGAFTNNNWTRSHHELLKAAASDPRVARIFIFPGAKVQMCNDETGDRSWLRKIRPWYGHHYHFHVRLSCPPDATGCVNQAPPPPGDGCADAQAWVNNILNPPPPDPNAPAPKPKRDLVMGDLPAQCASVLAAP